MEGFSLDHGMLCAGLGTPVPLFQLEIFPALAPPPPPALWQVPPPPAFAAAPLQYLAPLSLKLS